MIREEIILLYEVNLKGDFNMTSFIIIALTASFVGGCAYAIVKNKKEVEQFQVEAIKRAQLSIAVDALGISSSEYIALCTALGVEKANEMIIERWKTNNK